MRPEGDSRRAGCSVPKNQLLGVFGYLFVWFGEVTLLLG